MNEPRDIIDEEQLDEEQRLRAVAREVAEAFRADAADPQKCAALGREFYARVDAIKADIYAQLQRKRPAKVVYSRKPYGEILEAMAAKVLAEAGLS
jgi:hypothetical protein